MTGVAVHRGLKEPPLRILVMSPDRGEFRRIKEQLASNPAAAWEVLTAPTIEDARNRLKGEAFDLIVLDLALLEGADAAVVAEVGAWARAIPLVAFASEKQGPLANRMLGEGAVEWIPRKDLAGRLEPGRVAWLARSARMIRTLEGQLGQTRALNQEYQAVLRHTPDGLCRLDPEFRITLTNQTMKRIFDPALRMTEEVFGCPFQDFFNSPQEFNRFRESALESLRSTGIDTQEVPLHRWDGETIWAKISLAWADPVNADAGYVATITDISELRRTRDIVRYQEQFETLILRMCSRFINLHPADVDTGVQQALGEVGEFLGVDRCILFRFPQGGGWPPMIREWCAEGIGSVYTGGDLPSRESFNWLRERFSRFESIQVPDVQDANVGEAERKFLLERGIRSWLAVPMRSEQSLGGCIGFHCVRHPRSWTEEQVTLLRFLGQVFLNALERKETDDKLVKLSSVVEQTADSVLITDTNGNIEYVNPSFEEKTGYTSQEAIGKNPRIIRSGKHPREYYQNLWETIRRGDPFRGVIVNRRKSGELYYESETITPLRDSRGEITHYVSTAKDITELVQSEAERAVLLRLSQQLTLRVSLSEVARIVAREAQELFHHDSLWFSLYDEAHNALSALHVEDTPPGGDCPVPVAHEKVLYMKTEFPLYKTQKARLINRPQEPKESELVPCGYEERLSRSLMFAPICWEGRVIAALSVQSYTPGRYTERDLRVLESLAGLCGGVLARQRVEEERDALQRLSQQLATVRTMRDIGRALASECRSVLACDLFWIALYDPSRRQLTDAYVEDIPKSGGGPRPHLADAIEISEQEVKLYSAGKPGLIADAEDSTSVRLRGFGNPDRIGRSVLYAPVMWKGRLRAVMSAVSYTPHRFTSRELHLLEAFAEQCSGTLARVRAEEEREALQRIAHRLLQPLTVEGLSRIIAEESQRLFGHDAFLLDLFDESRTARLGVYYEDILPGQDRPSRVDPVPNEIVGEIGKRLVKGESILLNRRAEGDTEELSPFGDLSRPSRSLLFAPVRLEDDVIGVLSVQSYTANRYAEDDLHLLETVAAQCGVALARAQAVDALARETATLHHIIEYNPYAILVTNSEGRPVQANPAYLELFGEAPAAGYSIFEDPVLIERGLPVILNRLSAGEAITIPDVWRTLPAIPEDQPERRICVRSVVFPITGPNWKVENYVLMHENVTERKEAEEQLAASEEKFRAVIENLPVHVGATDDSGKFYIWNKISEKMFGYTSDEVVGTMALDVFLESPGLASRAFQIADAEGAFESELTLVRKSGERFPAQMTVLPKRDEAGRTVGYYGIAQDITERKQAEEERKRLYDELIQKERLAAMGQTIAEVAHCMKNIFTAVNGGIYLLEQSLKMNRWDLTRRAHAALRQSSTRLYLFLMNMLDYTKTREAVKEEVSVRSILDDVMRMLLASAQARTITIESHVDPGAEVLRLDSQSLFRALLNLGLNSIDAMPKGGSLMFHATLKRRVELLPFLGPPGGSKFDLLPEDTTLAVIEVVDTGTGISEEAMERLFEPFFSTKGSKGTGLGLSSARKFVEEQGGEIRLSSEVGKGTTFQLVFA